MTVVTPPASPIVTLITNSQWAKALSEDHRQKVFAEIYEKRVAEGAYICRKGELADCWWGVADGLIKVNSDAANGKSVTFTGVPTGGWVGEGSLIKNEPRRYDVVALRASVIACMPRSTFVWLLDNSIGFNRFMIAQLNERLSQVLGAMENDRLMDIDSRVAGALAGMFNPHLYPGIGLKLPISQEEIGFLAGVSRQRANTALKALEQEGLLKVDYGVVTILDLEGLRAFGRALC